TTVIVAIRSTSTPHRNADVVTKSVWMPCSHTTKKEEHIMTRLSPWKRHWGGNGGALTEWSAHPLERFRQEFNEMMERFFENFPAFAEERGWNVEVDDRDDELVVHAEAPGFAPEDFNVQVAGH